MANKKLSLTDATLIVSGSMIGSGIFIVSSEMARTVGSAGWLILAWVLTGVVTLLGALSFGELASMMPKAGGQYVYIQRAFGKLTAFVYGWTVFAVIQTGVIAAVAVAFAKFAGVFFPIVSENTVALNLGFMEITGAQFLAVSMVIFLTWLNTRGIKAGKWVQRIFTFTKIAALFGIIAIGLYYAVTQNVLAENFKNPWDSFTFNTSAMPGGWEAVTGMAVLFAFGTALLGSLFSSDAWNNVTFIAGEIENPHINIPRSLLIGTTVVTVIYCLANVAYLSLLPLKGGLVPGIEAQGISHALNDRVGSAAAGVIFGNSGIFFMAALIMISTFGCNNGLILAGGRLYKAMADDGLFFKKAGELNKNEAPANALWIQAIWASLLCLSGSYGQLIEYCMFASLVFYIVTVSGLFVLRRREPNADRPYKVKTILPILYIVLAALISLDLLVFKAQSSLIGIGVVLLGIPIYYFINARTAK